MKAMREILGDRMLATALAVVLAYLLAFQGFTGSLARAATAITAQDPFHVLCGSNGIIEKSSADTDDPLKRSADCPCASLCRLASSVAPVILSFGVFVLLPAAGDSQRIRFQGKLSPDLPRRDIVPDARGPPPLV